MESNLYVHVIDDSESCEVLVSFLQLVHLGIVNVIMSGSGMGVEVFINMPLILYQCLFMRYFNYTFQ